jgi:hypothetical protein
MEDAMANRNYITGGEVPPLTGSQERDLGELQAYLYKMVGQLKYELQKKDQEIQSLQEQLETLRSR